MTQSDSGWSSPSPQPEQPSSPSPQPEPSYPYQAAQPEQPYQAAQPEQPYQAAQPDLTQQYAGQPYPNQPYGNQPYAGQPAQQYPAYGYAPRPVMPKNDLGVLSLVFGLLGLLAFGLVGGIPAVILGLKAKQAVRQGLADNDGMATAGIVTGWIGIAWSALALVLVIIWFIFAFVVVGTAAVSDPSTFD